MEKLYVQKEAVPYTGKFSHLKFLQKQQFQILQITNVGKKKGVAWWHFHKIIFCNKAYIVDAIYGQSKETQNLWKFGYVKISWYKYTKLYNTCWTWCGCWCWRRQWQSCSDELRYVIVKSVSYLISIPVRDESHEKSIVMNNN